LDRRSFVLSLFGGLAAASVGGMGMAQAMTAAPAAAPLPGPEELAPAMKAGLDKADADFSQAVVRERVVVRRRRPYRRPVVVRRTVVVRRPRRVVRRRVIYR